MQGLCISYLQNVKFGKILNFKNHYQLLDNITEELNANGNECELEFMANNQFILTTYTSNGNCIINVMPGGANINCSVGICGTANLLYTDTYNFY